MDENDMKKKFFFNTKSPAYRRALEDCERVAASNVNVLLIGESGSGKDVAAQYIHACSRRSDMPLIAVNCNAYTESLLEAELFGHEQGAFTGAIKGRAGKFELADKGTYAVCRRYGIPVLCPADPGADPAAGTAVSE